MIGFNHQVPGMGQYPMPGYNTYSNPYCPINTIPAGNNLPYSQRLYNDNQQQFINELVTMPNMSYEEWKRQQGIVINSKEQEDYYLNFYNTAILPQQRAQYINNQRMNFYNQIGGQTMMPTPYFNPYAYQQYIYGYDKTKDMYEYHRALCGAIPQMQKFVNVSQADILKKRDQDIKNYFFITKKLVALSMKCNGRTDKEIADRLNKIDEETKPQKINIFGNIYDTTAKREVQPINKNQKVLTRNLVCGGKVVKSFGKFAVGQEPRKFSTAEIQAIQFERMQSLNAKEVFLVPTMNKAVHDKMQKAVDQYKDMPLVEFLNDHGGILVSEALERQFVNSYKHSLYNYDRSNYMNNIVTHSQYHVPQRVHPGAQSFYYTMKEDELKMKAIKDIAVKVPTKAPVEMSFVDYLNFLDGADPVSEAEYKKNLKLTNNVHDAQVMALYKSFHPEFDAEEYIKTQGKSGNPNGIMPLEEQSRLIKFYNAMIEHRPELRNGRIN